MTNIKQELFPGWRSGKGRLMAGMNLAVTQLAELLKVPVLSDHDTRYIWFENEVIGLFTVATDTRQSLEYSEVYVESDADRLQSFSVIIDTIIAKLPASIPCRLEDELDFDKAYRLAKANPAIGPL
jgi:hypothetical protein